MGIKGLTPLLKRFAPSCLINRPIDFLKGKKISFDMSIYFYKILYSPMVAEKNLNLNALIDFIQQNDIIPTFVID
ncbi:hypothetical protein AYI69_g6126, partial [Smittium culicis]